MGRRKESRKIMMLKCSAMEEFMGFKIECESCRTVRLLVLVKQTEELFY